MDPVRSLVEGLFRFDLWRNFRRVCWIGNWPPELPEGPVIAYSNHHSYYDGHLAWLLFRARLHRPPTTWMEEWDRFPFFAALGAQPFPLDDATRRAATIRRTGRRFEDDPQTVLIYYPEGRLHSPDEGIAPFDEAALQRIADFYEEARWWPYATHVTWRSGARPTALLTGGTVHDADGNEQARLTQLWQKLQQPRNGSNHVLLEGSRSAHELFDFSVLSSVFERYL